VVILFCYHAQQMHRIKIKDWHYIGNLLILLALLGGFEPPTDGLEDREIKDGRDGKSLAFLVLSIS
jgi:hypothetical protein